MHLKNWTQLTIVVRNVQISCLYVSFMCNVKTQMEKREIEWKGEGGQSRARLVFAGAFFFDSLNGCKQPYWVTSWLCDFCWYWGQKRWLEKKNALPTVLLAMSPVIKDLVFIRCNAANLRFCYTNTLIGRWEVGAICTMWRTTQVCYTLADFIGWWNISPFS